MPARSPEAAVFEDSIRSSFNRVKTGARDYGRTWSHLLRHPLAFVRLNDMHSHEAYRGALQFASYSVLVLFILSVPVLLSHGVPVEKASFIIRFLLQFLILGMALHLALKILGARTATWRATLAVYGHFAGAGAVIYLIAIYPIYLEVGPLLVLGGYADAARLGTMLSGSQALYLTLVGWAMTLVAVIVMPSWFSFTHGVGKGKAFFAMIVAGILGGAVQLFVLAPVMAATSGLIDTVFDVL